MSGVDPLGPVVITAREIYDQLVRLTDALSGVGTRLDRVADQLVDQRGDLVDHEQRLRTIERGRWPLPSVALLLSLAALVLTFVRG